MKNLLRLLILLLLVFTNLKLFAESIPVDNNSNWTHYIDGQIAAIEETVDSDPKILRIEFRVSNGASRSFVIGFTEDSTDGWDYGLDGGLIQNPPPDDMGSLLDGQQYIIQAFGPITPDKEIDLVLHATGNFNYSLIATEISNFHEDQDLFLRDNLTGQYLDLRSFKSYNFVSDAGTFTERFQVIFQDPAALSNEEFAISNTNIFVNQIEDKLYATSLPDQVVKLRIINMLGQNVKSHNSINTQDLNNGIDISLLDTGIYTVSILTENNNSIHKKVIVN